MKRSPEGVLGIFEYLDSAIDAVRALQAQNIRTMSVTTPVPHHDLEAALHEPRSPVRPRGDGRVVSHRAARSRRSC